MTAADCICRTATERLDDDDFAGALALARTGLVKHKDHAGLLQVYGLAAYHLGEPRAALAGLESASIVAPLAPVSQLALADLYMGSGMRKSAAAGLSFLTERGRCPNALLPDLARLLGKFGAYRSAFKVCRRIVRIRSWYHPAHYGMAHYLAKLNAPPTRVIRHLRAAVRLAPGAVPYRLALAGTLATARRPAEACDVIRPVPARAVNCPACLKRLLKAAEAANDSELVKRFQDRLRDVLQHRREAADGCCD